MGEPAIKPQEKDMILSFSKKLQSLVMAECDLWQEVVPVINDRMAIVCAAMRMQEDRIFEVVEAHKRMEKNG